MTLKSISEINVSDKRVFLRADLNVPIENRKISSTARIDATIPTIEYLLKEGAKVMLTSHLGRPEEGLYDEDLSLKPIADYLRTKLNISVRLIDDWVNNPVEIKHDELLVLENTRFNKGEKKCDETLSKYYADLADVFVMDAFGTAHRKEASTYGIGKYIKEKCAGFLFYDEVKALSKTFNNPDKPMVAVVGGSKVSSKLSVLNNLALRVDGLVLGGGILNTFLAAMGNNVGASLYEPGLIIEAKKIISFIEERGSKLPVIIDVVCAKEFSEDAKSEVKLIADVENDDIILDIGPYSISNVVEKINEAKTILWNGPVGVFEIDQFANGTKALAEAIANNTGYSLAGGGDTIASIEKFGIQNKVSYISTAGGAFLEFAEGKKLPAIEMLES